MISVFDIGSNTIRLVTYEKGEKISNIGVTSEILNDTQDEILTEKGTQKLCDTISFLKEKSGGIKSYAFATFAFRELKNRDEVKKIIFEKTGVDVEILSGRDEAECDFYGLMQSIPKNESGIGVDLGGGSAQIFSFEEGRLNFYESYPIGCNKLKKKFVEKIFPNAEEERAIDEYIEEKLSGLTLTEGKLYMMGGTAKTAARLYGFLNGSENSYTMKAEKIPEIIEFIEEAPEDVMRNVLKTRYDNIVVGIIIMEKIAKFFKADKIHIEKCGVREGYLYKKGH